MGSRRMGLVCQVGLFQACAKACSPAQSQKDSPAESRANSRSVLASMFPGPAVP